MSTTSPDSLFRHARGVIVVLVALLPLVGGLLTTPAAADRVRPDFFGMHVNDWSNPPKVPVGSSNFTTHGTYWNYVQPTEAVIDWGRIDRAVQGSRRKGAKPTIILGFSPTWASTKPKAERPQVHMPRIAEWRKYVTAVAQRYGTTLDYEIWPEPNVVENFRGSPKQMAQLTVVASKAIKRHAGRRANVVSPAMTLRLGYQRNWMMRYFKSRVGGKPVHRHIDAVAINPFPLPGGGPEDSTKLVKQAQRKLARIGVRKPIWTNEINYGVEGAGADSKANYSNAKQMSYVIRTYALHAAVGVDRVYWLGWFTHEPLAVSMATNSGKPKPAGRAYAVVHRWLLGTNVVGAKRQRNGVWVVTAKKGRQTRQIMWKPRGRAVIKTPRGTKKVENMKGKTITRKSRKRIRVTLKPIMIASRGRR